MLYCREKLRHFNELEHELDARLNRSHKFATRYIEQFTSPIAEINAKLIAFIAAALFTTIFLLSAWDEDVLNVCIFGTLSIYYSNKGMKFTILKCYRLNMS